MTKVLIINGHPNQESLNFGLSNAYKKGALAAGAEGKVTYFGPVKSSTEEVRKRWIVKAEQLGTNSK